MIRRILMICPSLIPGQSGVGDYTRRLAAECSRQGVTTQMLSLCDPGVRNQALEERQRDGATEVACLRLPVDWSWQQRQQALQPWLQEWQPEWASLQFVPFGYQRKGLPWQLGETLKHFPTKHRWQIMFHEVWVGAFAGAPWKLRLLGAVQRQLMIRLLRALNPARVHTQASPHQQLLRTLGAKAAKLPLFGNIPIEPNDPEEGRRLIFGGFQSENSASSGHHGWHIGGLFGVIHPEWQPESFFSQWIESAERLGRKPLLVLLGRSGRKEEEILDLTRRHATQLEVRSLGALPDRQISQVLQALDFGLATTPWQLREKSSALSTMREHGLPIVLTRDDWRPAGVSPSSESTTGEQGCFLTLADRPIPIHKLKRGPSADSLPDVAARFLADLHV